MLKMTMYRHEQDDIENLGCMMINPAFPEEVDDGRVEEGKGEGEVAHA